MLKQKVYLASNNYNKYKEIAEIFDLITGGKIKIVFYEDEIMVQENKSTYFENALIKAKYVYEKVKEPVIADDSGIEVYALAMKPGVKSKRVADSDIKRIDWMLRQLDGITDRRARFVACAVYLNKQEGSLMSVSSFCYGSIALNPSGSEGFGYDPIFIPEGYTKTFAELGLEIKNKISHRASAFKRLAKMLFGNYEQEVYFI